MSGVILVQVDNYSEHSLAWAAITCDYLSQSLSLKFMKIFLQIHKEGMKSCMLLIGFRLPQCLQVWGDALGYLGEMIIYNP